MKINPLFYLVFISQIILLSVFYANKIKKRTETFLNNYPESKYPKLYPKSAENYKKHINIYSKLNLLIFFLGVGVLYFVYSGALVGEKKLSPWIPWGYFMIQMIPNLLLDIWGMKTNKLMKIQDDRKVKTGSLQPRKLLNIIPPLLLLAVVLIFFSFVLFVLNSDQFVLSFDNKGFASILILLVGHVSFFSFLIWRIYGAKCNPYQSEIDRDKHLKLMAKTMCFTLIGCTLFVFFAFGSNPEQKALYMPIMMSIFLQGLTIFSTGYALQKYPLDEIDFDVYKAN